MIILLPSTLSAPCVGALFTYSPLLADFALPTLPAITGGR